MISMPKLMLLVVVLSPAQFTDPFVQRSIMCNMINIWKIYIYRHGFIPVSGEPALHIGITNDYSNSNSNFQIQKVFIAM